MIAGKDFIVLSDVLGGVPTSAHHLFQLIARDNRVFWFNTLGRLPKFSRLDYRKTVRVAQSWLGLGRKAQAAGAAAAGAIHAVSPVMVPWFTRLGRAVNRRLLLRCFRRLQALHDIRDPYLVTTFPVAADFFDALPGYKKVYYCVDDFLNYPGIDHARWAAMEQAMLDGVDGLVVTSRFLAGKQTRPGPLLHLPHGVDYAHFQRAGADFHPLEDLPRPIVGFFGLVSEWVDLHLIAHLARRFPKASFVLLGRAEVDLGPLAGVPNVHLYPFVPYAELPSVARHFDVGLIPFVLNDLTRAVNPLKLLEYFALGLPVLSTRLPELEDMPGPLRLAVTPAEFERELGALLGGLGRHDPAAARAVAKQHTWQQRVDSLYEFLYEMDGVAPATSTRAAWALAHGQ